jgi:hypothetical protein
MASAEPHSGASPRLAAWGCAPAGCVEFGKFFARSYIAGFRASLQAVS